MKPTPGAPRGPGRTPRGDARGERPRDARRALALFARLGTQRLVSLLQGQVFLNRSSAYLLWRHGIMRERAYRGALEALAKASDPLSLACRGRAHRVLGETEAARACLRAAARRRNAPAAALAWLWELDCAEPKAGPAPLEEAIRREPENGWWRLWRGIDHLRFNRLAQAAAELERAATALPREPLPRAARALALMDRGEHAAAEAELDAALALDGELDWAYPLRAQCRQTLGKHAACVADCDEAMRLDENVRPLAVLMGALHDPGLAASPQQMIARAGEIIAKDPHAYWALVYRSDMRRSPDANELHGSLQDLERALAVRPDCFWMWAHLGRTRVFLGDFDQGGEALRRAIALQPRCGWAHAWLGEYLRRAGDIAGAERAFARCLELYPDYELAYTGRGAALRALGRHREAARDLTLALRLDPTNQWAYYERHLAHRALRRWPEAFADLEAAHRRNPRFVWEERPDRYARSLAELDRAARGLKDDPLPRLWHGDLLLRLRDFAGAERALSQAIRLGPGLARAWLQRGRSRAELGAWRRAFSDFKRAVRLEPRDALPRAWLARARQLSGDLSGAAADYRRAARLESAHAWAVDSAGNLRLRKNRGRSKDPALRYLYLARLPIPSAWIWVCLAETEHARRRYRDAVAAADKALDIHARDADGFLWRGASRLALGELTGARADLEEALRLAPGRARALYFRGRLSEREGRLAEAREDYRRMLEASEGCPPPEVKAARAFLASPRARAAAPATEGLLGAARRAAGEGRHADAAAFYTEALGRRPDDAQIYAERAHAYRCLGRYELALADKDAIAKLLPGKSGPLAERGDLKRHLYDFAGGIADAEAALALDGADATAWTLKAECERSLGRRADAVASATRAVACGANWSWPLVVRAKALRYAGRPEAALEDLAAAGRLAPDDPYPHGWRGEVLRALDRRAEAVAALDAALRAAPHIAWFLAVRGEAKRESGRAPEGLADLLAAVRIDGNCSCAFDFIGAGVEPVDPRLAWAYAWRGGIHRKEGRLDAARRDLDRALALDPRCSWARAWRGELSAKEGRPADALADLGAALRRLPRYGDAHSWRGQALLAAGRFRPALAAFDRATALDPTQLWPLIGRAAALEKLGRAADARAALKRARARSPGAFAALMKSAGAGE